MLVNDLANRPARPARSCVLRLRGLPYRAVEDDIILFLAPLPVIRVHVCRRNGRTTGEAYVQFCTRHEAGEALVTKNRQHLGNRYIEVFEAGESDIGHLDQNPVNATTFSGNVVQPGLSRSTLRIAGLVSSTCAKDIVDLLQDVQLLRGLDSITFFGDAAFGNRAAVVEVADENAWQIALSRNQQPSGNGHLQVHPITHAELAALPRGTGQHNSSTQQSASTGPAQLQYMSVRPQLLPPPSFKTDGSTLKLRGLPYTASVSDILTFFEGFHLSQDDVHLETRNDRQDNPTGTGVAYVQFSSPDTAEEARNSKHKQSMGARYIECMTLTNGRHRLPLAGASLPATSSSFPPFVLPAGSESSGAAPHFPARQLQAVEPPMRSQGWSRPFSPQSLYPREAHLPLPVFRHGADQGTSSSSMTGGHHPTPAQAISATLLGPSGQVQGQVPLGVQQDHQRQQQQQLMIQQQYALQHQQQQLLMQQQAMRQWGGQQWQGNITPLGLGPQGWMGQPFPVRMAPAGPLQMSPMAARQNLQGGVALADPMAYGYPGPPAGYAWAPLHPANPPKLSAVMGAQAFAGGRQPLGGGAYPPRQDPLDARMPYSPHGGRTPGRGNVRTPFSSISHTRLSHPRSQSAAVTQPPSESALLSQVAMIADSSADATPTTQVIKNLEELSLTDSMSAQRLSPIVTHPGLSPSNVILASTAQSTAPGGQQQLAATAAAQSSPTLLLPQQAVQVSQSASLPVTVPSLTGSGIGNDAVAATEGTSAAPSSSQAAQD